MAEGKSQKGLHRNKESKQFLHQKPNQGAYYNQRGKETKQYLKNEVFLNRYHSSKLWKIKAYKISAKKKEKTW